MSGTSYRRGSLDGSLGGRRGLALRRGRGWHGFGLLLRRGRGGRLRRSLRNRSLGRSRAGSRLRVLCGYSNGGRLFCGWCFSRLWFRRTHQGLVDPDGRDRTDCHTRHAEYAVLFSRRVRLVRVGRTVILACISRILDPLENSDGTDRKASSVGDAVIPVDSHRGSMDAQGLDALACLRICGFHLFIGSCGALLTRSPRDMPLMLSGRLQVLVERIVNWHGYRSTIRQEEDVPDRRLLLRTLSDAMLVFERSKPRRLALLGEGGCAQSSTRIRPTPYPACRGWKRQ